MATEKVVSSFTFASKMEQQRVIDALGMMEASQLRAAKNAAIESIRTAFEAEARVTARLRDRVAQMELPL